MPTLPEPAARFALVRILGNDLPPRHHPAQTLRNLAFTLREEPLFADTLKLWVLNRLVDARREAALVGLLEDHGAAWLRIGFDARALGDCERAPLADYPLRAELADSAARRRHARCLYVMNVNGARNTAIDWGTARARWVLPLDGQCFFDAPAWNVLVGELEQGSDSRQCYALPMQRLDRLPQGPRASRPPATDEPQLLFGHRCSARFHPLYRYGRLPKVELLRRLGFPTRAAGALEVTDRERCRGYVYRLPSESAEAEGDWRARRAAREAGIDAMLASLERSRESAA